jgi:hypothetical protein
VAKNLFDRIKKFLPLIGIVLLFYLIYSLNLEDIKNAFLSIKPIYVILALLLTLPAILIRNYAWQLIQKEQKIKLSYFQSLKIFLIGYFYASITPAFVGHLMRIPYMNEKTGEPYGKLFINVIIEVTVRTIAIYIMIILGLIMVIESFPDIQFFKTIRIIMFIVLVFTILIVVYFFKRERGEKLFYLLVKYLIPKKFKSTYYDFVDTFYNDFPRFKQIIIPFLLGFVTWIIVFSQEYLIVMALEVNIPYLSFLLLFPVANVAGFLPITFAGLGVRETVSILIFSTLFAVTREEVLVFTLVGFIVTDIFTGFIGFLVSLTEVRKKRSISI